MSSENEDVIPLTYPYAWSPDSDLSLEDFLNKYRPSMVQNDGKKPWIWVRGSKRFTVDENLNVDEAKRAASKLLKEVTGKVEAIQNDPTIPTRSNKKTGAKSKKEIREQVQSEAKEKLTDIATKNGYVSGKWLVFASWEKVDTIWSSLASSLVSGPLAGTPASLAKVATSPEGEGLNNQHLICIYLPNIYDRDGVTEVMKVLLRHHGVNLSGVKPDMYTSIGIYSKHASGIPSTIWKSSDLLSDVEAKALKDAYFAEVSSNSKAGGDGEYSKNISNDNALVVPTKPKPKRKLKKKASDDPFASDENNDASEVMQDKIATKSKQDVDDVEEQEGPKNKKSRKL